MEMKGKEQLEIAVKQPLAALRCVDVRLPAKWVGLGRHHSISSTFRLELKVEYYTGGEKAAVAQGQGLVGECAWDVVGVGDVEQPMVDGKVQRRAEGVVHDSEYPALCNAVPKPVAVLLKVGQGFVDTEWSYDLYLSDLLVSKQHVYGRIKCDAVEA